MGDGEGEKEVELFLGGGGVHTAKYIGDTSNTYKPQACSLWWAASQVLWSISKAQYIALQTCCLQWGAKCVRNTVYLYISL